MRRTWPRILCLVCARRQPCALQLRWGFFTDQTSGFQKMWHTSLQTMGSVFWASTEFCRCDLRALFSHMPKGHVMGHIFISVKISALAHDYTLSPLCTSVQMDEDYIGRVSRLSRRTNPGQTVKRVLQRCLIASYKYWKRARMIISWKWMAQLMCWARFDRYIHCAK